MICAVMTLVSKLLNILKAFTQKCISVLRGFLRLDTEVPEEKMEKDLEDFNKDLNEVERVSDRIRKRMGI